LYFDVFNLIVSYDNINRRISWIDEITNINSKDEKLVTDLANKAYQKKRDIQIYILNSFVNSLKDIIKEKSSLLAFYFIIVVISSFQVNQTYKNLQKC
jgi:hypothetical protein